MKRKYTFVCQPILLLNIILIGCFYSVSTKAQSVEVDSLINKVSIGVHTGLNFPTMHYSEPDMYDYSSSLMMRGVLGFFAEINLTNEISIRPGFDFIGRGQKVEESDINYKFCSNYLDFRLPVLYHFKANNFTPYAMLAPYFGFATGGTVTLNQYTIDMNTATIAPADFGFLLGGGVKKEVAIAGFDLLAAVELNYNVGLSNTFSKQERNGSADAMNMSLYSINGSRKNRGVAINVSLAVPIRSIINVFTPKDEESGPVVNFKEYYTVDEINEMVGAGKDVTNKKIKMNNLNFEFGKSSLDNQSKQYLEKIVTLLKKNPSMKMKISGHTDNVGAEKFNLDLSQKRAEAVYNYLISQGISSDNLSYDFYGASKPISDNDTEEHQAENRRVEFKIIK